MFQIVLHSIQSIYTRKGDNRLVLSCFISNFGPFIKPSTYGSSNQAPSCPLVMWNGLISPRKNGWRGNGNKMQIHRGLNEVNVMEHIKKYLSPLKTKQNKPHHRGSTTFMIAFVDNTIKF